MVRRTSAVRRRGLSAYKVVELLSGVIQHPAKGYGGYGDPLLDKHLDRLTERHITDVMRQDWEENREALLAYWRSDTFDATEFGLSRVWPWLNPRRTSDTLPWAATRFDGDGLAGRAQRGREAAGERRGRS